MLLAQRYPVRTGRLRSLSESRGWNLSWRGAVHDFPKHSWHICERAQGLAYTVVNGTGLSEPGEHARALPGQIHRNALSLSEGASGFRALYERRKGDS
jgi:hypothetical protein